METVSSIGMHPTTYPNQRFHSKAAAVAATAALPARVHVTGGRNVKALRQAFLEKATRPGLMQTCKCFFKTLMRTWHADIRTWEGFQDQQSPSNPPVSSQYFSSTNSALLHKDGWKKSFCSLILPSPCLGRYWSLSLYLWVALSNSMSTDHLLLLYTEYRPSALLFHTNSEQYRAFLEVKILTVLSGIFKDQNKPLLFNSPTQWQSFPPQHCYIVLPPLFLNTQVLMYQSWSAMYIYTEVFSYFSVPAYK